MKTHEIGDFPIVGVGASAGGVEALCELFGTMRADIGLGFVVVTHLSPGRESALPGILATNTALPVDVVQEGMPVRPGHIYVLGKAAGLTIEDGRLRLRETGLDRLHNPIDTFFGSLAEDHADSSVGIILSGSGSDGTLGLRAIREAGGLTIAQGVDGTAPKYPSMPDTAIAADIVDLVLSAHEMAERLAPLARKPAPPGDAELTADTVDWPDLATARPAICAIVQKQIGHDFTGYKDRTFLRRVRRRLQVLQLDTADAYLDRLRQDPEEVVRLFRDLLIGVTSFFRDAEAFESLAATVLPKLFEDRGADDQVRVWVPGCSTGEEAYSLAILLREHMAGLRAAPRVQVFATDIDEHALAVARTARYPKAMLADRMTPEQLARHFTPDGDSLVVAREVRDLCAFSSHSLIRDPPFSRMDLISCRNLLIYLDLAVQQRIMPMFHYALRPGGHLFLSTSESIGLFGELFRPVDAKQRIFVRRDHAKAALVPLWLPGQSANGRANAGRSVTVTPSLRAAAEARVLERFAPPHVVVNRDGEVIHYSARTGRYLEAAPGAPSRHLLTMARKGLRLELRMVLQEAMQTLRPARRDGLAIELDDGVQMLGINVDPLPGDGPAQGHGQGAEPMFLVVFNDQGAAGPDAVRGQAGVDVETVALQLERELRDTRDRLQSTIEEYETSLEELKAANEEMVSINEELQSTNEELETTKEETQSVNEELQTVNQELQVKVDELDRANSDLRNLFDSTEIATVFLDPNLNIRSFTRAATEVFNLIPGDHGRPLLDIAGKLNYPTLHQDLATVLANGKPSEQQVARRDGTMHYLVRISPYRTEAGTTDGVVVAFVDVTSFAAAAHQRALVAELNHRVKNMLGVVVGIAAATLDTGPQRRTFVARLRALSRLHELLSREVWVAVQLRDVLLPEAEIYREAGRERVILTGPNLKISPRIALSLGLVVHELMTNAVKYGALSAEAGRVTVTWTVSTEGETRWLRLAWQERGGPAVAPPDRRGFGSRVIEREVTHGMGGKVDLDFAAAGLDVTILIPIAGPDGGVLTVARSLAILAAPQPVG